MPQDLLAVVGKEFSVVVTPRRESLDALYSHLQMQIAEPIIRANVTMRQGKTDPTTGQNNESLPVPQAPNLVQGTGETSTPPPSINPTPGSVPSLGSTMDEVVSNSSGRSTMEKTLSRRKA